jgi:hypothetical protein
VCFFVALGVGPLPPPASMLVTVDVHVFEPMPVMTPAKARANGDMDGFSVSVPAGAATMHSLLTACFASQPKIEQRGPVTLFMEKVRQTLARISCEPAVATTDRQRCHTFSPILMRCGARGVQKKSLWPVTSDKQLQEYLASHSTTTKEMFLRVSSQPQSR